MLLAKLLGSSLTVAVGSLDFIDNGGTFTTLEVPGANQTFAFGINTAGQIIGVR